MQLYISALDFVRAAVDGLSCGLLSKTMPPPPQCTKHIAGSASQQSKLKAVAGMVY